MPATAVGAGLGVGGASCAPRADESASVPRQTTTARREVQIIRFPSGGFESEIVSKGTLVRTAWDCQSCRIAPVRLAWALIRLRWYRTRCRTGYTIFQARQRFPGREQHRSVHSER